MELMNKRIAFLGDSITEGYMVDDISNVYWNILARDTGAQCFGYGVGGSRFALQRVPSECPQHDMYFASRIEGMITDADIVVVFGGTNDFGCGDAPFGNFDDRTEETFCGAFHCLLQKLIARHPRAQLVVMTPLHRLNENDYINSWGIRTVAPLRQYVDTIIDICAYYSVPVLDLYRVSGLQPAVPIVQELYMPDGLHPNAAGQKLIADKLRGFLNML